MLGLHHLKKVMSAPTDRLLNLVVFACSRLWVRDTEVCSQALRAPSIAQEPNLELATFGTESGRGEPFPGAVAAAPEKPLSASASLLVSTRAAHACSVFKPEDQKRAPERTENRTSLF
eukprot:SAG11_NODE_1956_length_4002_cov_5.858827_4_plen_118_part_00